MKIAKIIIKILCTIGIAFLGFIAAIWDLIALSLDSVGNLTPIFGAVISLLAALALIFLIWGIIKKKFIWIPLVCLTLVCAGAIPIDLYIESLYKLPDDDTPKVAGDFNIDEYMPFTEDSKVALLDEEPTLDFGYDPSMLPVMDGAAALFPVYSSFMRALYPNGSNIQYTNTRGAYRGIVDGDCDIIFVVAPSDEQLQYAEDNDVTLEFTPIGKEAFVFFVNAKNPIDSLTVDQIKEIYSGKIKNWSELGVNDLGNIRAFQRNDGSGSQSALINLMEDTPLMRPLTEDVPGAMIGIIEKTADYRNYNNAIGFSFRFYATEMVKNDQIKLLSLDGVAPTEENVRNGSYPLISEFYAVTRSDADKNTLRLLEWILSPQGQELIEKTGYTPIN